MRWPAPSGTATDDGDDDDMRIGPGERPAHLSYCTDVHAGESWSAHVAELERHVPAVRTALLASRGGPDEPFGIGLRLSVAALDELETPDALARFDDWLARELDRVAHRP